MSKNDNNYGHIQQEKLLQIIKRPHLSEKSSIVSDKHRQFVFGVDSCSEKHDIKCAVEMLFNVKVDSVRVCNVKGKKRQYKQHEGQRKGWKKAYVSLKEGYDIDFTGNK